MADRFCRRTEGNEDAFVVVSMVFDAVSAGRLEGGLEHCRNQCKCTFVFCATAIADKDGVLVARRAIQQITTVCTEDERPYCRHFACCDLGSFFQTRLQLFRML